jgi:hypothetical protein
VLLPHIRPLSNLSPIYPRKRFFRLSPVNIKIE